MASNSIGQVFRVTTFGESHGPVIGAVVDGCPAGLPLSVEAIQQDLNRRRPGQSALTSPRNEADRVQIVSGIFEGRTTGAPIALLLANEDIRSADYNHLQNTYRPSHADYTYETKYGLRDHRGGGRSSARATAALVAAGGVAKQLLATADIRIAAFVTQVGSESVSLPLATDPPQLDAWLAVSEANAIRCPDAEAADRMIALVEEARSAGDTLGGIITAVIDPCPPALGEPLFGKLQADLAHAMLCINAVHGFDYGSGFAGASRYGSEHNDVFFNDQGTIRTRTNYSGGIQGGITNGMPVYFRVAFKPVATLMQVQTSVDREGEPVTLEGRGRHDPCVLPRAVPIVEAAAAIVLADHLLRSRMARI
ncbi:MAG: chorismate synthase [Chitinophagales bacterium]|nr:chorismate synthase [Chitinophagales bacterium]MDW8393430.1 chorismate synthase [Chitinophagales bacterium]